MKPVKIIFVLFLALFVVSCERNMDDNQPEAEYFIDLLQSGEYNAFMLPKLTSESIPTLLKYADSKEHITNFPVNPISSFYREECRLGIYVLWVVEAIRLAPNKSEDGTMPYASQNPLLIRKENADSAQFHPLGTDDETSHSQVAQAYRDWWKNHENMIFFLYKNVDPLEGSEYQWH
ncbi:MAG TPA: DUF4943 family protein [Bacteroidales bacterium]|nr:DUF4943 family protein [Bacteroidales bacterium]